MVIEYHDGDAFLNENASFLSENKYTSSLFFVDAPLLGKSENNYALCAMNGKKRLLTIRVEPYNTLFCGDKECLEETLAYVKRQGFEFPGAMCPTDIGERLVEISKKAIGKEFYLHIAMDFMKSDRITEKSSAEVTTPSIDDVDELFELTAAFINDCRLTDKPNKDRIKDRIASFRIIRKDGRIVCMARMGPDGEGSARVAMVYTRPEYRGQGYARKVVNALRNEIIALGLTATLNVDQANPISNHLYSSLGFRKVFSQGIYLAN